jgi:D-serine deaminase-like pyridoxal phosphate-dependent protein
VQQDYGYYRQIFASHPKPFAYIDLDLLEQNVQAILKRSGEKHVRLASKSIRSVAMLRRLLDADPRFQGIMCFTAREAVWLASQGFDDLLIGYPTWQPGDIAAVAQAVAAGKQITLMVDCVEHVEHIAEVARQHDAHLPVCIEVDLSIDVPGLHFGVWRSTLRTPAQARPVVESILAAPQLTLDGIMGYEAQVAGLGDTFPGKAVQNAIVRALKRRSVREAAARRDAILNLIASYGHSLRFVNGGGTGSVATTREEAGVTEITVGSGFYSPALFDYYRDFRYLPAAGFAVEIVRRPRPDLYTCLGGGYIASGATGGEKQPKPYLPDGARLLPAEGAGEVQTPIHYAGRERLDLGDPIFLRHSKAGELCEHFSRLALVSKGQIAGETETYRGAGQTFL